METMTLTGKGRQNLIRLVYYVYEIKSKIFFLINFFSLGGVIRFGQKLFPLADTFYLGIILESPCIQVNMVSSFCSPSDVT
jgi:hypothetical protein